MDYLIKMKYPKDRNLNYFKVWLNRLKRKGVHLIAPLEYLVDRKDVLEELKRMAEKYGVEVKVTEYEELPNSIKKVLEQTELPVNPKDNQIEEKYEKILAGYKEFLKIFRTFKGQFKKKTDVITVSDFNKIFGSSNRAAIDKATREVES